MTIAPQLERELIEAVRRHAGPSPAARREAARRRWWRARPSIAVAILAGVLALTGVALAATGLLQSGAPVKLANGAPLSPRSGYGVPRPGGAHLLSIATPDPSGGPPWGARFVATTRGIGCLQIGRLVRGQLGVIGTDGAFDDDGLFHALPDDYLQGPFPCATLDADGHAFAAVVIYDMPTSGMPGSCLARGAHTSAATRKNTPTCRAADERLVMAGMAGPQAKRVTYRDEGKLASVATAGPDGAYLIVLRKPRSIREDEGYSPVIGGVSGGSIVKIEYRDGKIEYRDGKTTDCQPTGAPPTNHVCRPVGEVARTPTHLHDAAFRAPVSLELRQGPGKERTLEVGFKARIAVQNASSQYWISTNEVPGPKGKCGYSTAGPLDQDVTRGQQLRYRMRISDQCHGPPTITVTYSQDTGSSDALGPLGGTLGRAGLLLVGRHTVTLP